VRLGNYGVYKVTKGRHAGKTVYYDDEAVFEDELGEEATYIFCFLEGCEKVIRLLPEFVKEAPNYDAARFLASAPPSIRRIMKENKSDV
jgi:hypothetical protein